MNSLKKISNNWFNYYVEYSLKNKNQKNFPCLQKYDDLYSFRMQFSSRAKRQTSNNFSLKSGNLLSVFKIRKLFGSKLLSVHLKFSFENASQTLVVKILQKTCFFLEMSIKVVSAENVTLDAHTSSFEKFIENYFSQNLQRRLGLSKCF